MEKVFDLVRKGKVKLADGKILLIDSHPKLTDEYKEENQIEDTFLY